MPRKSLSLFCVAILASAGCALKQARQFDSYIIADQDKSQDQNARMSLPMLAREIRVGSGFAASRYVAVRHKLEIVEPGSALAKSIEATVAFCGTIQCEVLSSSVT